MALTAYSKSCAKHTAGNVKDLILIAANDIDALTVNGSNEIINLTVGTESNAVDVSADIDGVKRVEESTGNRNGVYNVTQKIEIHLSKATTTLRTFIDSVADQSACGIVGLVKDNNGLWWVCGIDDDDISNDTVQRGLYVETNTFDSGMAPTDEDTDKFILTLSGTFANHAYQVNGAVDEPATGTTTVIPG